MEIKLYNDIVFKWIFGRQEHTRPLVDFLNSVLDYEVGGNGEKFTSVEVLNPYDQSEPFTSEKQGILDLRVKEANTGEWIDLEIQVVYSSDYAQRSKFYLAGMYRDQLKQSKKPNYDELKPCYGIHLLVDTWFKDEADKAHWFHHYSMLNTRTYKPLINHWNLYYVELDKFLKHSQKDSKHKKLEQWSYFLGKVRDSSDQLDPFIKDNEGIKEVYEMLQTFTKDDRRREQYRLHEEWLRVQRGEQALRERLQRNFQNERKAKEKALQRIEKMEKHSILLMKRSGSSDEEIAQSLEISLKRIQAVSLSIRSEP